MMEMSVLSAVEGVAGILAAARDPNSQAVAGEHVQTQGSNQS